MRGLSARLGVAMVAVALGTGCLADEDYVIEDEATGKLVGALSSQNSLSTNALSANKISSNKISSNKISSNKISSNNLQFNTGTGWVVNGQPAQTTPEGKELLRYLVKCAFPAGVSLTNGADSFPGLLGLAPAWETRALTTLEQQKITACLGAHTNKFGTSVSISVRWDGTISSDESNHNDADAAFFGNYFADGKIYVCKLPLVSSYNNGPDKAKRVCDDSNADCGFTKTAYDCTIMCGNYVMSGPRKVFYGCTPTIGTGVSFPFVMNVYLRSS